VERLAAGGQDSQVRAAPQQGLHDGRRGVDQVLAVVQDEQEPAPGEMAGEGLEQRLARPLDDAEHRRDRLGDQGAVVERGQRDEPDLGRLAGREPAGHLDRKPRLAQSGRARDGDEPRFREQSGQVGHVVLAPDEAGRLRRQPDSPPAGNTRIPAPSPRHLTAFRSLAGCSGAFQVVSPGSFRLPRRPGARLRSSMMQG
jgi:hypothetical protein